MIRLFPLRLGKLHCFIEFFGSLEKQCNYVSCLFFSQICQDVYVKKQDPEGQGC